MAKFTGLKQLLAKKFKFLRGLTPEILHSFGRMTQRFIMIIWGASGNGKSNLVMELAKLCMANGSVLYVSLEEGTEETIRMTSLRKLNAESHSGKIIFAEDMDYEQLREYLRRKKSPRYVIIDSIQYFNIKYEQYKELKEEFVRKSFIFISHAKGKNPDGRTADKIRYDAPIKVFVQGYVAFVISRFGGNHPFLIWEEGARKYWGAKKLKQMITQPDKKNEKAPVPDGLVLDEEKAPLLEQPVV